MIKNRYSFAYGQGYIELLFRTVIPEVVVVNLQY